MLINQKDVFEANFPFPDGQYTPHPVIVLSVPSVFELESTFIGVPISDSMKWNDDEFSFPIDNNDFEKAIIKDDSYVRMHLVTVLHEKDLTIPKYRRNTMKQDAFNHLIEQIQELIFGLLPPTDDL
jgi:hypothetical protein